MLAGNFLYIETSQPRKQGDTASIQSQVVTDTNPQCFTFWYFMHGSSLGALNVSYVMQNVPTPTQLWGQAGEQGSVWKQASVDIPTTPASINVSHLILWAHILRKKSLIFSLFTIKAP